MAIEIVTVQPSSEFDMVEEEHYKCLCYPRDGKYGKFDIYMQTQITSFTMYDPL
jgi:hypothetical protein